MRLAATTTAAGSMTAPDGRLGFLPPAYLQVHKKKPLAANDCKGFGVHQGPLRASAILKR